MLTYTELVSLSHLLRDERVLSVYIDGTAEDPASRRVWRVQLDHSLKDLRRWLEGSSHEERVVFEQCVRLLDEQLARLAGAVGAPGWVAFISDSGVHDAEPLPVPMPTLAVWSTGICMAPYIRALKQTRPVVVVVADARKAHIYRYVAGTLTPAETIHAHAVTEPPSHMGDPPRSGFHGGTRGATGRDAAQRTLMEGTDRMVADVARTMLALAGSDGWILIGGIPHVGAQVARALERVAGRVLHLDTLDIHATDAQIAAAAQHGASLLRDNTDLRNVSEIIDRADANGTVAVGPAATRHALGQLRVRELYFTHQYVEDHLADAEEAVRAALAQGAAIEEVSRDAAHRLDAHGGMGARLRYVVPGSAGQAARRAGDARGELAASEQDETER